MRVNPSVDNGGGSGMLPYPKPDREPRSRPEKEDGIMEAAHPEGSLSVSVEQIPGKDAFLVRVVGPSVSSRNHDPLQNALTQLLQQQRYWLILDCTGLDALGSVGWGILVWTQTKAAEGGGQVVVMNPSRLVRQLLTTFGAEDLGLKVCNTISEALRTFRESGSP